MTRHLEDLGREFTALRAESAALRVRLQEVRARISELQPQINNEIISEASFGHRQADLARLSGYTRERVRQILHAAHVEPVE